MDPRSAPQFLRLRAPRLKYLRANERRTLRPAYGTLLHPPTVEITDLALYGRAELLHQVERALEQAISALEPMYREVLLLRDVEGLSAPEVAQVLGVTVQAVKSRRHRARLSVRERVAPVLGVDLGRPAADGGRCQA